MVQLQFRFHLKPLQIFCIIFFVSDIFKMTDKLIDDAVIKGQNL